MSRLPFLFLIGLLFILPQDESLAEVNVELNSSYLLGNTTTELKFLLDDPMNPGTEVEGRSQLEFPLGYILLGADIEWKMGETWAFGAGLKKSVSSADKTMIDEDWIDDRPVSYTESNTSGDYIHISSLLYYRLKQFETSSLSLSLSFDWQRIEQDVENYDGWQANFATGERFEVSGTGPALRYRVDYLVTQLGMHAEKSSGETWKLFADLGAGVVFASDEDDHLLRSRLSKGDGYGFALSSTAGLEARVGHIASSPLAVNATIDFLYLEAPGTARQEWYGDDGSTPAGTVTDNISYEMRSTQFQVQLGLALSF